MEFLFSGIAITYRGHFCVYQVLEVDTGVYFAYTNNELDYYYKPTHNEFYLTKLGKIWVADTYQNPDIVADLGKQIDDFLFEKNYKKR